ncbi:hypothetical protein DNK47_03050 [Mycoplasma wenyonii]|uniref:Uncharacterized protein n=1 Tax=Mycoplasma wenyonii TaxID=65123 RepID=A0A328PM42_9MOLU|nr:hypothetical protein [Mycoplasma wenyonii]RAO94805.1 hypothetical protein DNK47_03050 [Mycoplasma wenyonii]
MNIFFKFLALGGLGGTVAGAYHLSKQEYKNNHIESTEKEAEEVAKDVDVKRQPNTSLTPQEQKPKVQDTKTEATKTEAAK